MDKAIMDKLMAKAYNELTLEELRYLVERTSFRIVVNNGKATMVVIN